MSTIIEIEDAIQKLPQPQVDELAAWLEEFRARRSSSSSVDEWLAHARGAAVLGETTEKVMAISRGED